MARNFFDGGDTPHSKAKRKVLQNILTAVCGRRFHDLNVFRNDEYVMRYVDAFAGRGWFGRTPPDGNFDYNDDVCVWGTPIIAISVLIDCMNNLLLRTSTDEANFILLKTVEFYFNDASPQNIDELSLKISQQFEDYGWDENVLPASKPFRKIVEYIGPFGSTKQSVRIYFSAKKFDKITFFDELQPPMFSFIDPFGIAQIPMKMVSKLLGNEREIFINLMVGTLNRSISNPRHVKTITKLLGKPETALIASKETENLSKRQRLKNLCQIYQKRLKTVHRKQTITGTKLFSAKMSFKKGKSDQNCGTIYNMIFGTTSLSVLNNVKTAMQRNNQITGDLVFTDYFAFNGINIPTGRKTSNDQEAEIIYQALVRKCQPMLLGEVKRFIIEKSPFPYHARALRVLEKDVRMTVDPVDEYKEPVYRSRKELCARLSHRPKDPDIGTSKYGNFWRIRFHPRAEQRISKLPAKPRRVKCVNDDDGAGRRKREMKRNSNANI